MNNIVGEAFRLAYAQQRLLAESKRVGAQTQTPTDSPTRANVASSSVDVNSNDPSATVDPVPSGVVTNSTASTGLSKPEKTGYTLDSGLRYVHILVSVAVNNELFFSGFNITFKSINSHRKRSESNSNTTLQQVILMS